MNNSQHMDKADVNQSQTILEKEPWFATNLSLFFPGIGQIYSGNKLKGVIFIISKIILSCWMLWIIIFPDKHLLIDGLIWLFFYVLIGNWNLIDAYKSTKRINSAAFEDIRKRNKDPWLAVFMSRIIPGMGHLYIGSYLIGSILVVIALVAYIVPFGHTILNNTILFLVVPFSLYHVYITAPVKRERSKKNITIVLIATVLVPLFVSIPSALFVKNIVAEAHWITSRGMEPTLNASPSQWEADNVTVDKLNYRFSQPKRGDIILFSPTEALQKEEYIEPFVKRIIALPGEKVELKNGNVYINDKPLSEDTYLSEEQSTLIDTCTSESQPVFISKPVTIPENSYFVLGDDRNSSYDSRCWGTVPKKNIIGKVSKIFFPFSRIRSL